MSKHNFFSNCAFNFYLALRKNKPIIFFIEKNILWNDKIKQFSKCLGTQLLDFNSALQLL